VAPILSKEISYIFVRVAFPTEPAPLHVVIFRVKELSIREDRMGLLMLKCPSTGKEFSTGIITDAETFKKLPNTATKAACPHCGQSHRWLANEARLLEGDAARPSA
jgi:hypothetical protein